MAESRTRAVALAFVLALIVPASALGHGSRVTGTLVEMHGHGSDGTVVEQSSYAIQSDEGQVRRLGGAQPQTLIGQRVYADDGSPAPGVQGTARAAGEQRLAAGAEPGPRSLLVILVAVPGLPVLSTPDGARDAIFTGSESTNALFRQQSDGATELVGLVSREGDVTAPVTVDPGSPDCYAHADSIADAADDGARAAGWRVGDYDHVLYALPTGLSCPSGFARMPGRRLWVRTLATRIVAHELGHNLGAYHANAYHCTDANGVRVTLSDTCIESPYNDPFDLMGQVLHLMSSWHRARVGQLPDARVVTLVDSQTVGLVSSDDFETEGPHLLLVPRKKPHIGVTSWFALEVRSELKPFDLWVPPVVTTGLSLRIVASLTENVSTLLLDAQTATGHHGDAPLPVGETFRDDPYGIAIRLVSVDGTTAKVTVSMPVFDEVPPSPPGGISYNGDTNGVVVRWGAAADDQGIARYEVRRDGVLIGTTPGLVFDDARVAHLTQATYEVTAVDTSENRSSPVSLRTAVLADATPPGLVPGLSSSVRGEEVTLSWQAASDNRAVVRYRVRRDGVARMVEGLSFVDRPPAGTNRYAVSGIDMAGNAGPESETAVESRADVVRGPAPDPAAPGPAALPTPAPGILEPLQVPPGAGAGTGIRAKRPRIVLLRRSRRGGVVTMSFAAAGATSMRAIRAGRRVASARGSRLKVRLRAPRGVRRARVKIVAVSRTGSVSRTFVVR